MMEEGPGKFGDLGVSGFKDPWSSPGQPTDSSVLGFLGVS